MAKEQSEKKDLAQSTRENREDLPEEVNLNYVLKDNQKFTELKSLRLEFLLERQHVCVTEA
jgi:hypothetical protein